MHPIKLNFIIKFSLRKCSETLKFPSSDLKKLSIKSPSKSPFKKDSKKSLSNKIVNNKAQRKLNFEDETIMETLSCHLKTIRACLHSKQLPENLWTREEECEKIRKFILASLYAKNRGGNANSVYIAGVPGTGKTACVLKVCFLFKKLINFRLWKI